jgi:hypothetical protein
LSRFKILYSRTRAHICGTKANKLNTTRKNCFRYLKLMSPLNAAICTTISYYRNDLRVTLTSRSNNCFLNSIIQVCWCMTIRRCVAYRNDLRETLTFVLKDKNVMVRTRKYYLKNNYLTLRSKIKVSRRSLRMRHNALWSCTHILA